MNSIAVVLRRAHVRRPFWVTAGGGVGGLHGTMERLGFGIQVCFGDWARVRFGSLVARSASVRYFAYVAEEGALKVCGVASWGRLGAKSE